MQPAVFTDLVNFDRGQCRLSADGQCFFSDEGDATEDYPAFGSCTVRLTRQATLDSVRFRLGTGDFVLIPGNSPFSNQMGPANLSVNGNVEITFFADNNPFTTDGGFEICIVP